MFEKIQLDLFPTKNANVIEDDASSKEIRIITFNLQNPSLSRARKQVDWLLGAQANVMILTEAKYSQGCKEIVKELSQNGFTVIVPPKNNQSESDSYISIIATKGFSVHEWHFTIPYLNNRIASTCIETFIGKVHLLGMYVPAHNSFDNSKNHRKDVFHKHFVSGISSICDTIQKNAFIVGGDLNVLEPNHDPIIPHFKQWEHFYNSLKKAGLLDAFRIINPDMIDHSWFGRSYSLRLDHFFISKQLLNFVDECHYIHHPRLCSLSDHSAMIMVIKENQINNAKIGSP
jgi:exodeoxyribonuclease-3